MGDLLAWLLSFFILIGILGVVLYQLMCLADLEFDYINPYDTTLRINRSILPEFFVQGSLCLLHLGAGHWFMFLSCIPYLCYNVRSYIRRDHLVDVTEIFNHLSWEKNKRLYKLAYLVGLLLLSITWMIWSIVD